MRVSELSAPNRHSAVHVSWELLLPGSWSDGDMRECVHMWNN